MPARTVSSKIWLLLITSVACARPAPPAAAPGSVSAAAAPAAPSGQRFTATKGVVVITISDQPGPVVDTTAPPPPPGYPAPTNPYLSATCGGDAVGCSEAGTLLRAARSARELADSLRKAGFAVTSD